MLTPAPASTSSSLQTRAALSRTCNLQAHGIAQGRLHQVCRQRLHVRARSMRSPSYRAAHQRLHARTAAPQGSVVGGMPRSTRAGRPAFGVHVFARTGSTRPARMRCFWPNVGPKRQPINATALVLIVCTTPQDSPQTAPKDVPDRTNACLLEYTPVHARLGTGARTRLDACVCACKCLRAATLWAPIIALQHGPCFMGLS